MSVSDDVLAENHEKCRKAIVKQEHLYCKTSQINVLKISTQQNNEL